MNNIKKMREKNNITQCQLSESLGISQSTIAMWETGETMPRAALLPKIAKILKCSIDDLFKTKEAV